MAQQPIGLQLWSLREAAKEDFVKVLEQVGKMGYAGVEFAGYFGLTGSELKSLLKENNLEPLSSHVGYDILKNDLAQVLDYSREVGIKRIVCPSPPGELRDGDKAGWQRFAESLSEIGDQCNSAGISLGYHNHSWELKPLESGEYPLDVLFDTADPGFVFPQLDLGWIMYAGVDPLVYLQKYSKRCPLVHVKDFSNGKQVEVGLGEMDLAGLWKLADQVGLEALIIETEEYTMDPLDSVKVGLDNLNQARK